MSEFPKAGDLVFAGDDIHDQDFDPPISRKGSPLAVLSGGPKFINGLPWSNEHFVVFDSSSRRKLSLSVSVVFEKLGEGTWRVKQKFEDGLLYGRVLK